jgi:CheY-like chemotaxis protein
MHETILIAEDYDDTRNLMKFILEDFGYQVEEASNGQEAVEKVKYNFPDLILMDMAMPVMDGLTATRIIRKFDGAARLPIIAFTAFGKSFYRQAIEAGCDDLINKPVNPAILKSILDQYLSQ